MVGRHERNLNTAPDAVDDLVLLRTSDINEKGIVNNLRNRYNDQLIYTYIGPVLLSVNPFQNIRGLYTEDLMQEYYGRYKFEVAPHVFASAEEAHRKLMGTGINQCVLISGESGAGKTEAAKKVMEYVSKVSADTTDMRASVVKNITRTVAEIKDSLLKSNPVLEAFGNAKTLRNDNSSRFGKYMEILMDYNGTPLGGKISNYLLEKPRVVHQTNGERNFHIFYLLCNGMGSRDRRYKDLCLDDGSRFDYLCDNSAMKVNTIDDAAWFEEMDTAMASVGINDNVKMDMYRLVSAILWLGNVKFQKDKNKDACKVQNKDVLKVAAQLLSVKPEELENALTTRSRETSIDKLNSPLVSVDECNKVRDALAKALYARLFERLVSCINETIRTQISELSLGVLDIYGFEIFEHNSFEQLCINYCNEKLQQYFIQLTLQAEQEEYIREGIEWKNIEYFNNQIVCELIESRRPAGVIAFMDEEITLNRGAGANSDMSFLAKMNQQLKMHQHYVIPPSNKAAPEEFVIRHYAGDVMYSVDGMVDKNKDTLFRDLLVLAGQKSRSQFISTMFPEGREKHDFKKPVTAGTQFVNDMKDLIATLEKCEPHYIRCIKPNDNKRSNFYDDQRVLHQVKYLGLLENVRVRRAGYAYRREYNLFVRRYKMLTTETWKMRGGRSDPKRDTETILSSVGIRGDEYKFGKTKIFIESPQSLFTLEKAREKAMHWVCGIIQNAYRKWKLRLYFQQIRELAVNLLHTKKRRNNSWVLYYLGDYIETSKNDAIMSKIRENNDGKVVFADHVDIYNLANNTPKKGKAKGNLKSRETIVITPRSFYVFTKNLTNVQRIPFDKIQNFGFSKFADDFVAITLKSEYDTNGKKLILKPSIILESVRKSEIATVLNEQYKNSSGGQAPLIFEDEQRVVILRKKKGMMAAFAKAKPVEHTISWSEDGMIPGKRSQMMPPPGKNEPGYDPMYPVTRIAVSAKLGSQAELQLHGAIPDRVLAHTKEGRQGKKKVRRNRRAY